MPNPEPGARSSVGAADRPPLDPHGEPPLRATLAFSFTLGALIVLGWTAAFLLYLWRS